MATQSNQEAAGNITYLNASWVELAGINSSLCCLKEPPQGEERGVFYVIVTKISQTHHSLEESILGSLCMSRAQMFFTDDLLSISPKKNRKQIGVLPHFYTFPIKHADSDGTVMGVDCHVQ